MARKKRYLFHALGALFIAAVTASAGQWTASGSAVRRRLLSFDENTHQATVDAVKQREVVAVVAVADPVPSPGPAMFQSRNDRDGTRTEQEPGTTSTRRDKKRRKKKNTEKQKRPTAKKETRQKDVEAEARLHNQADAAIFEALNHDEVGAEAAVDGGEREMGTLEKVPLPEVSVATGAPVPVWMDAPEYLPTSVSRDGLEAGTLHAKDIPGPKARATETAAEVGGSLPALQSSRPRGVASFGVENGEAATTEAGSALGDLVAPRLPVALTAEIRDSTPLVIANASAGVTAASLDLPDARNETVTGLVTRGSKDTASPGQVHANSSADAGVSGLLGTAGTEDSNSLPSLGRDRDITEEASSSSNDNSPANSANSYRSGVRKDPGSHNGENSDKSRFRSGVTKDTGSYDGESGDESSGSSGLEVLLNPGGVSDVNTSTAAFYSLGTGSIVAVVGVVVSIVGLLVLFVLIGRKNYTDEDDESPLPYRYSMTMHSVSRLSPTFLEDDLPMDDGYNDTILTARVPSYHFDSASSTSGESSDEVPSLRGDMIAGKHRDLLDDNGVWSRMPPMQSINGDVDVDTGNVRISALYSAGSSMTSSSGISGSWSSVLASDLEQSTTRDTRDTSLSAWSVTDSSLGSSFASGASGMHCMNGSSPVDGHDASGSTQICSSSHFSDYALESTRVNARPTGINSSVDSTDV
uniref:Transmembrane protein n=1 Tax=Peronospora matthiolae TaxID=2874970 RepID=A0AAV1U9M8_9STRA